MCAQVRIDHKNGTVHFGALALESDQLRDNMSTLARRLAKALQIINPTPASSKLEAKKKVWLILPRFSLHQELWVTGSAMLPWSHHRRTQGFVPGWFCSLQSYAHWHRSNAIGTRG